MSVGVGVQLFDRCVTARKPPSWNFVANCEVLPLRANGRHHRFTGGCRSAASDTGGAAQHSWLQLQQRVWNALRGLRKVTGVTVSLKRGSLTGVLRPAGCSCCC
jgi:hypothetical protein